MPALTKLVNNSLTGTGFTAFELGKCETARKKVILHTEPMHDIYTQYLD